MRRLTLAVPLQKARVIAPIAGKPNVEGWSLQKRETDSLTSLHSGANDADMIVMAEVEMSDEEGSCSGG